MNQAEKENIQENIIIQDANYENYKSTVDAYEKKLVEKEEERRKEAFQLETTIKSLKSDVANKDKKILDLQGESEQERKMRVEAENKLMAHTYYKQDFAERNYIAEQMRKKKDFGERFAQRFAEKLNKLKK